MVENRIVESARRRAPTALCLAKRWAHHSRSGGYDRLRTELHARVVRRGAASGLLARIGRKLWRGMQQGRTLPMGYRFEDWLAECRVLLSAPFLRPEIVHVLYGDEQLDLIRRRRRLLPAPLVATFHLPSTRVREKMETIAGEERNRIDAAIVLSKAEVSNYEAWLGAGRVWFVPHGIDVDAFAPTPHPSRDAAGLRLLFVGEHMRDWNALRAIIHELDSARLPVQIDAVVTQRGRAELGCCRGVRTHGDVSESELVQFYQGADALLLPVIDATANNSVLESLACGCPVISNAVNGIPDYVDDSCGWLFPQGEVAAVVALLRRVCADKSEAECRRSGARRKALSFRWQLVASQTRAVYENARWNFQRAADGRRARGGRAVPGRSQPSRLRA